MPASNFRVSFLIRTVAQKGHTCKFKMLLQIKNSTCKPKIVLQIENRKHIDAN